MASGTAPVFSCATLHGGATMYDDEYPDFAEPGGRSALRRATRSNPRNLPCPTCGKPNRLTLADKRKGYQCDECADRAEGIYMGGDY